VVGDQEKACAVAKQWAQTFPRDYPAHIDFAICLKLLGQPDRALAEIREAVRLLPSAQSYLWRPELSIPAGRVQEAKAALDQASARGPDSIEVRYERGRVSFLEGDTAVMHAQMRWAEGKPGRLRSSWENPSSRRTMAGSIAPGRCSSVPWRWAPRAGCCPP